VCFGSVGRDDSLLLFPLHRLDILYHSVTAMVGAGVSISAGLTAAYSFESGCRLRRVVVM